MTGLSHTATGVVIALAAPSPVLAMVLAFVSHFVLDFMPHYGDSSRDGSDRFFRFFIIADAVAGIGLAIIMMILIPEYRLIIALCGILATIPDIMWLPNHIRQIRKIETKPHNAIMRWHNSIQFEHPVWGVVAEVIWLVAMVALLIVGFLGF